MSLSFSFVSLITKKVASSQRRHIVNMSKPRVLIASNEVPQQALDLLRTKCDLTVMPCPFPERKDVLAAIPGHDGLFVVPPMNFVTESEFLNVAGSKLKVISTMSSGYDHLDVPEIKRRGIKVGNTPQVVSSAVAEIAVLLMLNAARRGYEGRLKMLEGEVKTLNWLLGQEIRGSTVGIVGLGNIGQRIAKRLSGFEVDRFLYSGHSRKKAGDDLGAIFVSLDELLEQSDFVVVALPLSNETRGTFDDDAFAKMKTNAVFVNVGRGAVVNTDSLVRALRSKKIFAAGLDVTDPEPLPAEHALFSLPNAVIIPHLGTATTRTTIDMAIAAAQNILKGLEGQPLLYEL